MKLNQKKIIFSLIVFVLMWVSFGAGIYLSGKNRALSDLADAESIYLGKVLNKYSSVKMDKLATDVDFKLFWQVWDSIKSQYVDQDKISDKKMFYGAIRGMVAAVGDPYTLFMDPKIAKEFSNDLAGTFEGIGAEIGIKNDTLTIIAPLPDMPAEKAGLRSGDKILAIDGTSTSGMFVDEAVNLIRGPKETKVTLTVAREGVSGIKEYVLTRGTIIVKSVHAEMRKDGVFYISITNFNEDTAALFNDAVQKMIEANPKGIVLDLRSDPGGFLDTAIEVASEWVQNNIVVIEKQGDGTKNENLSRGRARLKGYPTVVLVNGGSASASEIVAGALQDYNLATLVGEKTFGKGSVQTLDNFSDGSSVKITVAKWLTPLGHSINEEGIDPDVVVPLTVADYNADKDPQMDAAIRILTSGESLDKIKKEYATSTVVAAISSSTSETAQ
jgi:carboxyl-terminal processing protease